MPNTKTRQGLNTGGVAPYLNRSNRWVPYLPKHGHAAGIPSIQSLATGLVFARVYRGEHLFPQRPELRGTNKGGREPLIEITQAPFYPGMFREAMPDIIEAFFPSGNNNLAVPEKTTPIYLFFRILREQDLGIGIIHIYPNGLPAFI